MQFLMALALLFAAGDECVRQTDLSCPAKTIAASIIIYDCSASDGSHYDLWQFSGKAGDTITIDMHRSQGTGNGSQVVFSPPHLSPVTCDP